MAIKKEAKKKKEAKHSDRKENIAEKAIQLPGGKKHADKKERKIKIPGIRKAKEEKAVEVKKSDKNLLDPYSVLRFVLMTEKAVRMVEAQNKLVFIVDRRYDKKEIKKAASAAFESEIEKVNTVIDQKGRKKAYIKFAKAGQAGDIAVRLGII